MSPTRDCGDSRLLMLDLNPPHYKLEFVDQPSHEFRFRYVSEFKKGSHGCLKSDRGKRRKEGGGPRIKINYAGTLVVEVGLYTAIEPRREHVHKLVEGSKTDNKIGKVFFKVGVNGLSNPNGSLEIELRNMNILHMGKDEVDKYIKDWLLECKEMTMADFEKQSVKQKKSFEEELKEKKREIENNVVLGVKVYVDDQLVAGPCYSNKISNTKTVKKLNIEDISKVSGCCTGGDEIYIFCDKLKLEDIDKSDCDNSDIAIQFYDSEWTAIAKIVKIHHQAAIIFATPPYKDVKIRQPQEVEMRLIRRSDNESSDPRRFTYEPIHDPIDLPNKRFKGVHHAKDNDQDFASKRIPNEEEKAAHGLLTLSRGGTASDDSQQISDQECSSSTDPVDVFSQLECFISEFPADELIDTFDNVESLVNDPMLSGNFEDDVEMDFNKKIITIEEHLSSLKLFNAADGSNIVENTTAVEEKPKPTLISKQNRDILSLLYRLVLHTANYLHGYARTGDINVLLMSMRHLIVMEDEHGNNVLHTSVLHSQISVLRSFLEVARSVSEYDVLKQVNQLNQSPLHLAVIKNNEKIVKLLLYYGVNPNLRDRNGNTAIHLSAQQATGSCLQVILDTLNYAFKFSNHKPNLDMRNYEGFTPLHLAVINNSFANVKQLCSANCDLNLQDYYSGRSALHLALENENVDIVELLLQNVNVETDLHTFNGNTPLHLAVLRNHLEIVKLLMKAKADPYLENNCIFDEDESLEENVTLEEFRGSTPLDLARSHEIRECLQGYPNNELLTLKGKTALTEDSILKKRMSSGDFSRKEMMDSGMGLSASDINCSVLSTRASAQSLADILDYKAIEKLSSVLNLKNCEEILNSMNKSELIGIVGIKENPIQAMLKLLQVGDEIKFKQTLVESGFQEASHLFNVGRLTT